MSDHPSSFHKSLPRLPSADDAYEPEDVDEEQQSTPKVQPKEPPGTPSTLKVALPGGPDENASSSSLPSEQDRTPRPSEFQSGPPSATDSVLTSSTDFSSSSSSTTDDVGSLQLLAGLRYKFQQHEQELYSELSHTSEKNLNDVRRSFVTAARGATKRLAAWEKKHASDTQGRHGARGEVLEVPEPEWWKSGCHAVPGGNIIVREDDWGSIIAFTLRCAAEPSVIDGRKHLTRIGVAALPTTRESCRTCPWRQRPHLRPLRRPRRRQRCHALRYSVPQSRLDGSCPARRPTNQIQTSTTRAGRNQKRTRR